VRASVRAASRVDPITVWCVPIACATGIPATVAASAFGGGSERMGSVRELAPWGVALARDDVLGGGGVLV
jgi:hypothetical protein